MQETWEFITLYDSAVYIVCPLWNNTVHADMSSALVGRRLLRQQQLLLQIQLRLRDHKITILMAQMLKRVQPIVIMVELMSSDGHAVRSPFLNSWCFL